MVLEKTEIHANIGEERKKMGFPDIITRMVSYLQGMEPTALALLTLREGTPGLATCSHVREKCSQAWLISSWASAQANRLFLGNGWALGLGVWGHSLGRKAK